jgi:hypothetical protein
MSDIYEMMEKIEKENDKLKKRVQDRIDLYVYQKGEIEEKTAKTKNLEQEIKEQEKLVADRVNIYKARIKELEEKYDNMYKKVINLEVNIEDTKYKLLDNDLFTGDTLFDRSVGRTDFPTGNTLELRNSLKKILSFNINFTIYPGHDNISTIEEQKIKNHYLKF